LQVPACFMLVSCSDCFSTLNVVAMWSSKTSADFYRTTWILLSVSTLSLALSLWLNSPLFCGHFFQFLNPIHSRFDSLGGESARRKAATYTQNNINTE
jgi:hypothetical protein